MRFATIALAMALGLGLVTACPHPYSGKPEKVSKPRKKKRPAPTEEEAQAAAAEQKLDEKCRTNFYDAPTTRRNRSLATRLAKQAEPILVEAEEQESQQRIDAVKDALGKLRSAFKADPYSPEATYQMAVAYALVGKKGCSVALLKRLQELTILPEVGPEAERTINRALQDHSFEPFRKDADQALGR